MTQMDNKELIKKNTHTYCQDTYGRTNQPIPVDNRRVAANQSVIALRCCGAGRSRMARTADHTKSQKLPDAKTVIIIQPHRMDF